MTCGFQTNENFLTLVDRAAGVDVKEEVSLLDDLVHRFFDDVEFPDPVSLNVWRG